jgi:hypothetical protein
LPSRSRMKISVAWKFFVSQSRKMWTRCKKRVRDGGGDGGSGEGGETGADAGMGGADMAGCPIGFITCGIAGTAGGGGAFCSGAGVGGSGGLDRTVATPPDVKPMNEASKPGSAAERRAGATGRSSCSARCRTSDGSSHGLTGSI